MLSVYVDQGTPKETTLLWCTEGWNKGVFLPPPGWSEACDPGGELPSRDVGSRDEGTRGEGERIFSILYV